MLRRGVPVHKRSEWILGLVSTTQAFAPVLAANNGGAFINVLSVVSWVAMPNLATYSASKSAAWSFTNAARVVLKRHGTQVVAVPAVEEQFNAAAVS